MNRIHHRQRFLAVFLVAVGVAGFSKTSMSQGVLTPGVTAFGALGSVSDVNTWTFTANAGESVVVRLGDLILTGTNSLDPYLNLYAPGGALVSTAGGYGDKTGEVATRAAASGTFTVNVSAGARPGGYRLTLAKTGTGTSMTNGVMHRGSIDTGNLDAWTFHANSGDGILVRMGNSTTDGTLDPNLRLFGPDGAYLTGVSGYGYKAEDIQIRAASSGTFTALVSGGNGAAGSSGDYRITLAKTGSAIVTSSGDEGGPMTNGFMHMGTIDFGDLDVWSISAKAGERIVVRMGDISATDALDPYLHVYAPDGTLLQSVGGYGSIAEEVETQATSDGTYTVTLTGANFAAGGTGPYRITVAKTGSSVVVSPGDEGGALVNGQDQTGGLSIGDLDVWTFNAFAGTRPTVRIHQLSGQSDFQPWVRLYGADGRLLSSQSGSPDAIAGFSPTTNELVTVVVGDAGEGLAHTGTYSIAFLCGCGANLAVYANSGSTNFFSDQLHVVPMVASNSPDAILVGAIIEIKGAATITHTNQVPQPIVTNTPVYMNDLIKATTNAFIQILFCDNTVWALSLPPNALAKVDRFYDPNAPPPSYSSIRYFFDYISSLIKKNDSPDSETFEGIGTRGDASDYINRLDILLNPGALLVTASPVTLYSAVTVPTNAFMMKFDFAYLQSSGSLTVALGSIPIYSCAADTTNSPNLVNHVSFLVTNPAVLGLGLTELTFNFNGPAAGQDLWLDNVIFPGLQNGDFTSFDLNWFSRGHGTTQLAAIASPLCSEYTIMSCAISNNQTTLSWPITATNYILQTATNPAFSGNWTAVTNAIITGTQSFTVSIPNTAATQFYRLKLNCN